MARIRLGNLKGPKGDRGERGPKGDPFTFADFTQEQLEKLKWPKGGTANIDVNTIKTKLVNGNIYVNGNDLNSILLAIADKLATPNNTYYLGGIKLDVFGKSLRANATNYDGVSIFTDLIGDTLFDKLVMHSDVKVIIDLGNRWSKHVKEIYVETPKNISFKGANASMRLTVSTPSQAPKIINFTKNIIEWSEADNSYINVGDVNSAEDVL